MQNDIKLFSFPPKKSNMKMRKLRIAKHLHAFAQVSDFLGWPGRRVPTGSRLGVVKANEKRIIW